MKKCLISFLLGVIAVVCINATFETDITCHYTQSDREVVLMENLNTDGRTKRVAYELYTDRVFRGIISNEVVYATNEVDSGRAVVRTVPIDPRRQ